MDAIFIDQVGNKKNFLYQYDVGQTCIVENFEYSAAPKAQFQIKSLKTSPSTSTQIVDGDLRISIPDMLLTYGEDIVVYLYIQDAVKGNIVETLFISVVPRKQPANYPYTSEMYARTINGTTVSQGFGYSDLGEWSDGNNNDEDRFGYFVTINYISGKMIVNKATSINNAHGITIKQPGFASNCDEWKGDILGKYVYVCSNGFVPVIDNGRCQIGGMCVPSSDGTAISSSTFGYKVLARIDSSHVFIFLGSNMAAINNSTDSLNSHISNRNNPHSVTKAQVGLSNCDNTSDVNKPVSAAQASEIARVEGLANNAQNDVDTHSAKTDNPHSVTKAQVELGNCDNTSDIDKPVSTAQATAIADAKKAGTDAQSTIDTHKADTANPHQVTKTQVGLGNCDNTSDVDKPISTAQSDEFTRIEGLVNDAQSDIDTHVARVNNPHGVTAAQVGLGNVDNTADVDKPISTAQSEEFARIEGLITAAQGDTSGHAARTDNPHSVTKTQVGLGNVDNTSDADKPISTATQTALDKKADLGDDGLVLSSQLPSTIGWDSVTDKPTEFNPSTHASTHFAGGSDSITPESIGAKSATDNDIFIATYDTTTSTEIEAAYQAGKSVICKRTTETGIVQMAPLTFRKSAAWHIFFLSVVGNEGTTIECVGDTWNVTSSPILTVDSELSTSSENPIQNKVVSDKINYLESLISSMDSQIGTMQLRISELENRISNLESMG